MKKFGIMGIVILLLLCCSCSDQPPRDFDVTYAKAAVVSYYWKNFAFIDADTNITYIGYDKMENRAEFLVADSVRDQLGDSDLRVGTFYVTKVKEGYYLAMSADIDEMRCGTYYPEDMQIREKQGDDLLIAKNEIILAEENPKISVKTAMTVTKGLTTALEPTLFKEKGDGYYTVFTVRNYGRMYVCYQKDRTVADLSAVHPVPDCTLSDFQTIQIGTSFFADVCKIDELAFYQPGNDCQSVHWLADGSIVTIQYDPITEIVQDVKYSENETWFDAFQAADVAAYVK